ncbi:nitrous oxide reductase family maturation protein NosD [Pseudoduganella flava]|uniref:Nitrous oxide reductase family maturation protein NosD n=1 Tax=Pseudoduganella flava TaxID=871742 RepID=A0ABX6G2N1_9BURK|nr:nitrous oxide reductase family maturation protein NosD [Pseudoduganella flava]
MISAALATAALVTCAAHGAVLPVHAGESIGAAIARAQPGDTVRVEQGTYLEHLRIDKRLTLEGRGKPVISAGGSGDAIRITAPDVTVAGLVVKDSGTDLTAQNANIYVMPGAHRVTIRDCELSHGLFGIWLEGSDDARLLKNVVKGRADLQSAARGNGIQVYATKGAQVIGNEISDSRDGIYVDVSRDALFRGNRIHHVRYGTHYMNTNHSTWEDNVVYQSRAGLALMEVRDIIVRRNVAWGHTDHGIMLRTIQDSVIEDNVVAGNDRGFFIYDAEYNVVRRNLVINNRTGVHLSAGSSNNRVDGNDFIGNEEQVRFVAAHDVQWGREQGNYWSNYAGWDQNGDGVGDVAYEANDVVDRLAWRYPLMKLLAASPALQTLRFVARQFPLLRAPSVVDGRPRMRPATTDWKKWHDTYPR